MCIETYFWNCCRFFFLPRFYDSMMINKKFVWMNQTAAHQRDISGKIHTTWPAVMFANNKLINAILSGCWWGIILIKQMHTRPQFTVTISNCFHNIPKYYQNYRNKSQIGLDKTGEKVKLINFITIINWLISNPFSVIAKSTGSYLISRLTDERHYS